MKKRNEGDTSALYVWNGICMFWGTSFHTDPHLHNTLQLVFDLDKKFKLKDEDSDWTAYKAAIIRDGHMHQLDSCGSIQLFIYLDRSSDYAKKLVQRYLTDGNIADLQFSGIRNLSNNFFKKLLVTSDCNHLFRGCYTIFDHLIKSQPQERIGRVDERIIRAVDFITHSKSRQIKVKSIAEHVCLSESRLRFLFKEQVGQPIQNFLLWMKVVDSLNLVLQGKELSQSAIDAGFWDSAHMSRAYKDILGLAPGKVKAYEKNFKIISCTKSNFYTLRTEIHKSLNSKKAEVIIDI